jgi:micrococcal nuclease
MVNIMMVRQGFAVPLVVPPNVRYADAVRAVADSARDAKLGLWAVGAFECSPEAFRDGLCAAAATVESAPATVLPLASPPADCDPSYPDVCIPSPPPDLDCGDISHRGFRVVGNDPHRLDGGHDGIGCERLP